MERCSERTGVKGAWTVGTVVVEATAEGREIIVGLDEVEELVEGEVDLVAWVEEAMEATEGSRGVGTQGETGVDDKAHI